MTGRRREKKNERRREENMERKEAFCARLVKVGEGYNPHK